MTKIKFHPSYLQIIYLILFILLFVLVLYIPTLISGPIRLTKNIILAEEIIEGSILGILFILSIFISILYRKEASMHKEMIRQINMDKKTIEDRLTDSDKYIGTINVQIREIKSIFSSINEYPETKAELQKTFSFFGERILGIVNSDWVLIRIIDSNTLRTIGEHFGARHSITSDYPHVSNKLILENQSIPSCTSVISNPKNLNILVFCFMPVEKLSENQRVFIQAIINEITKIYVILNSTYYKNKILDQDNIDQN